MAGIKWILKQKVIMNLTLITFSFKIHFIPAIDLDYKTIVYLNPSSSHSLRALIRPGRFDSRINIPLPDVKARYEILKLHAKKVKMSEGQILVYRSQQIEFEYANFVF